MVQEYHINKSKILSLYLAKSLKYCKKQYIKLI